MASAPAKGDEWIAIGEAARIMQCSKSWILVLLRDGRLEGQKIHSRAWAVSRKAALRNAEEYASGLGKPRVGRPRADNPPPAAPGGLHPGRGVGSPRDNNPKGRAVVAAALNPAIETADGMILPASELLAIGTAANVAGFHRTHLHGLIKAGKLWAVEIDRQWFVRKSDARALRGKRTNRGRPKKSDA